MVVTNLKTNVISMQKLPSELLSQIENGKQLNVLEDLKNEEGFEIVVGNLLHKIQVSQEDEILVYFTIDLQPVIQDSDFNIDQLTHIIIDHRQTKGVLVIRIDQQFQFRFFTIEITQNGQFVGKLIINTNVEGVEKLTLENGILTTYPLKKNSKLSVKMDEDDKVHVSFIPEITG